MEIKDNPQVMHLIEQCEKHLKRLRKEVGENDVRYVERYARSLDHDSKALVNCLSDYREEK